MQENVIYTWPESQSLMNKKGFRENCRLINGERGIEEYGSSAYVVPLEWLKTAQEWSDGEEDDNWMEPDSEIYDEEMEELMLL